MISTACFYLLGLNLGAFERPNQYQFPSSPAAVPSRELHVFIGSPLERDWMKLVKNYFVLSLDLFLISTFHT